MDSKIILVLSVCLFLFLAGCVTQEITSSAQPSGNQPGQPQTPGNMAPINQSPQQHIPPFNLPSLDLSNPSKGPLLAGENKTLRLGNLEFNYYSVAATYPIYSLGADILIVAKNKGSGPESFSLTPISELRANVPNWNRHFFSFQPDNLTLEPGEEKTLHYFASADNQGQFDVMIDFMQGANKETADITVYSSSMDEARLDGSAIIYGTVRNGEENPVQYPGLTFFTFGGRENYHAQGTDAYGRYFVIVPGVDDVQKLYGGQKILSNIEYFAITDNSPSHEGYAHYYKDGIAPKRGEKLEVNITLQKASLQKEYEMKWESKVSDYYGFFYAFPDENWSVVAAAQAKHDPQLGKPTNFYLFNASTGGLLWKKATGDECWGFDIKNGLVAAGCSDARVYVVGTDGEKRWEKDCGTMNREVEFSPDGSLLLTGPCGDGDYELLNANTGN
ncbi:hypothetical protein COU36_03295, partial [Candidatus Micrarchaeota archaeon CG10_big_fil_rev_8_21_14_0_10_59_7]